MDELREAWERDGYVVLRGAAPDDAPAAYADDLARLHDGLLVRAPGDDRVSLAGRQAADATAGVVDPYALSDAARALLLTPTVVGFLTDAVYDGTPPLLFDAAEAAAGAPDPAPYRDATYTALADQPQRLVTLTVAVGDAQLVVYRGSQTIVTAPFSGRYRHFNPERDGDAALQRHRDELAAALAERDDTAVDAIVLAAGDAVLWAADLVHSPVSGAALVAHLAPSGVRPGWFAYRPERARQAAHADGAAWLTSQHYDLVDAVQPEQAPAELQDPEELERVEEALLEHDQELAAEPPPNPATAAPDRGAGPSDPRHGGGLVDSVRRGLRRRRRHH